MNKRYKISICMMVKNEESNLLRCLESIKPIIDSGIGELILVDTGSTDKTINIAKKYTNKIYFHKWNKNFSEMRNITISYAKGEWIFILDADERVDNCKELIEIIKLDKFNNFNTILLNVKNMDNNIDKNKYNSIISPRLFKNDGSFKYEGIVHNQPIYKEPILKTDINITHFGYMSSDKELMEKKFKRTSELLKNELLKDPNNLYYIYQLGVSYDMHGDKEEALNEFRRAYSILKNEDKNKKKSYICIYGAYCNTAFSNNMKKESMKIAKETIELEKEYVDIYYILAMLEKEFGNSKYSFEYFNKYLNLINKYSELEISKSIGVVNYLIDNNSISNAYFEIYMYYLNNEDYLNAYNNYKEITSINQKIYAGINILIKLEKYEELKQIYDNLENEEDKNIFLLTLENKLKNIENSNRKEVYRLFSLNEDIYGDFNKLRLINNEKEREELANILINKIDFNNSLLFYSEIFKYLKNNIPLIIKNFKSIEVIYLRNIIKELIEDKNLKECFEKYIFASKVDLNTLEELKIRNSISSVLMINYIENNSKINDEYLKMSKSYIQSGIKFVSSIYQIENAEKIYKYVNNEEDRFFILMYIIEKNINIKDKKTAIKYMLEVIHLNKELIKYVEVYKDEILKIEEYKNINEEFENYKIKVKENIIELINNKNLNEAKQIISEYESIVKDDAEIYSIKAIIYTMEENFNEAKSILEKGLILYPKNEDLLYNLEYLLSKCNFNEDKKSLN